MHCEEQRYAIREVAELTGIKPVTLRAWQRRYNIIQPQRTDKGHRLYTQQHIEQIKTIQGWLEKGVAIGKVKALLESDCDLVDDDISDNEQLLEVELMLVALTELNKNKAESILTQVFKEYPLALVQRRFIDPIYGAIKQVKRAQQTLLLGMFQSLLLFRTSAILEAENKVAHDGKCLVVSYDDLGSINLRLWALSLAEKGYNISIIEAVDDASALVGSLALEKYTSISFFASQSPSQGQLPVIEKLRCHYGEACLLNPLLGSLIQAKG